MTKFRLEAKGYKVGDKIDSSIIQTLASATETITLKELIEKTNPDDIKL